MAPITLSIVSHGHGRIVENLLNDLIQVAEVERIVLTHNIPEPDTGISTSLQSRITQVTNTRPKGFGANHNAAFQYCDTDYYCVVNPDVRLLDNPFPALLEAAADPDVAMVAPMAVDESNSKQDTARHYLSLHKILMRKIRARKNDYEFEFGDAPVRPEWVSGMFMLFKTDAYKAVNGFDESYFMYCEDTDICGRIWKEKRAVVLNPKARVVHVAQRASHNSFRHLFWHVSSVLRFLLRQAAGRFGTAV